MHYAFRCRIYTKDDYMSIYCSNGTVVLSAKFYIFLQHIYNFPTPCSSSKTLIDHQAKSHEETNSADVVYNCDLCEFTSVKIWTKVTRKLKLYCYKEQCCFVTLLII